MPTVEHNFEDSDVICLNSDDDDDEIDVGGPEAVVAKPANEDMSWLTKLAGFARAEVEKQKQEQQLLLQATAAQEDESSDDDIEIISSNITPKPMVVPVSIRVPKSIENKIRESLVENGGTNLKANKDFSKALETALGYNIRNFNFFLPPSGKAEPSNNVRPAEPTIVLTKKEKETKGTKPDDVTPSTGETSRPSSKVARISPSSRRNLVSQEELVSTEASKISGLPSHSDDKHNSSNHRKSGKEDQIALNSFYGFSSNDETGSLEENASTKEIDDSFSVSRLPLFKDGRSTNGRMICKKQAFYSAEQPKYASKATCLTSKTSLPPCNKSQSTKSPYKGKKRKVPSSTTNDHITSPSDKSPDKSGKKQKTTLTTDSGVELETRSGINLRPKRHYPKPDDFYNDDDFAFFDDDEIYEPHVKTSTEKQTCEKGASLKGHVAKKTTSKGPLPDEVRHFKSIITEVNHTASEFLSNIDIRFSNKYQSHFVSLLEFEELFVDFKNLLDSSKLLQLFGQNIEENFLFDNWQVSHVSMKAANVILTLLGKKPSVIALLYHQLSVLPTVRLTRVDLSERVESSKDLEKIRRRNAKFHPQCDLSKSYGLERSITAKIRPKYRKLASSLSVENANFYMTKDSNIVTIQHDNARPNRDKSKRKLSNNFPPVCQDSSDTDNDDTLSSQVESSVWTPVKMVGSKPVRKFPQNWTNPSQLASKRAASESAEETKRTTPNVAKKPRFACIEMPTFTLGGLPQTLPSHIEGWFSNKLNRLKGLANLGGDCKNKAKDSNVFAASIKRLKFERCCTTDVKKLVEKRVSVSVGNIPLESIIELSDYKKKNFAESCNELSVDHLLTSSVSTTTTIVAGTSTPQQMQEQQPEKIPLRSDFSELLKVARKIEKISSQGFGKAPPKETSCFLPPGWFRRIRVDSLLEEFVRVSDGLVVPTVACAINKHLGDVARPRKNRKCARKPAKPMKILF